MEQTLYIVSLTGIYPGEEGDHSLWLFDNRESAIRTYDSAVKETKEYYKEYIESDEAAEYEDDDCYSLRHENSLVDIFIRDITADGLLTQFTF